MFQEIQPGGGGEATRRTVQVPMPVRTIVSEVVGDYSLPDYQPEIKRLLRIEAVPLPPAEGVSGGELGGVLDYYVLYMGHDNALYCAPLSAEYRIELPAVEGEAYPGGIGEPILCLCDTVAETPTGRVSAPRRLNIRTKLRSRVSLYGECPLEGEDTPSSDTEILAGEASVGRLYCGMSEPLALQDDIILAPSESGEWRIVCAEGKVMLTEVIPTAGQVSCRGDVLTKLTLCPAEPSMPHTEGGELPSASTLTVLQRKLPFSTSVELEGVTPTSAATACGFCTDISVQMEEGEVHVDVGVLLEARAQQNEHIRYRKDLYSTRREGESHYTVYPTEMAARALVGNFTLSDSLPLAEAGIDPAARIADVTATAVPSELIVIPDKGRCVLTGTCRARLLLCKDGEYTSTDMELPFRYEFDDPTLRALAVPEDSMIPSTDYDGRVVAVSCRARMDGERVGLDAELAVSLRTHRSAPITALSEVILGDEVTRRRGEYVVCFPAPDDTLWSVAKRYHAPMAALTAANNLSPAPADSAESLEGVGYLIV